MGNNNYSDGDVMNSNTIADLKSLIGEVVTKHIDISHKHKLFHTALNIGCCYMTNIEDDTIIWVNDNTKRTFGDDLIGKVCYEALQGRLSVCDFCTNNKIKEQPNVPYEWTFYHQGANKLYYITDVYIKLNGFRVRFEQAIHITKEKLLELNEKANKYGIL